MENQVTPQVETPTQPEAAKVEAPVTEVKETEVQDEAFKANFDKIAKQEKFQAETRQRLELEKKALAQDKELIAEYNKLKQLRSENPLKVLEHFGLTLEEIQQAQQNSKAIDPAAAKALEAVERLQAELKAEKDAIKRQKETRYEKELALEIETTVTKGEYDIIQNLGLQAEVRQHMENIYDKTGEILEIEEACKQVNNYYVEQIKKVMGSKWLKEQIIEPKAEEVKAPEKEVASLSNKLNSNAGTKQKFMTKQEREDAAIAILKGIK